MLIDFAVENWRSIRDPISLNLCANGEELFKDRVYTIPKYGTELLPITSIFGGNASGKSNLIDAINFAEMMVCYQPDNQSTYRLNPFRLDSSSRNGASKFEFTILVKNTVYRYYFELNEKAIVQEELGEVVPEREEAKFIYKRHGQKFRFSEELKSDSVVKELSKSTQTNRLFLPHVAENYNKRTWPVYDWFKESLYVITPSNHYGFRQLLRMDEVRKLVNEILPGLDCGALQVDNQEVTAKISSSTKSKFKKIVGNKFVRPYDYYDSSTIVSKKGEKESLERLATIHDSNSDEAVQFEIFDESDGTQRILELLPSFVGLTQPDSNLVVIIDELDRSLHTLLTYELLNFYLNNRGKKSQSQLIFTTHDALLMSQNLFRRDEIWITERNESGVTSLTSIDQFDSAKNEEFEFHKDYLLGRFGGIPQIVLAGVDLSVAKEN